MSKSKKLLQSHRKSFLGILYMWLLLASMDVRIKTIVGLDWIEDWRPFDYFKYCRPSYCFKEHWPFDYLKDCRPWNSFKSWPQAYRRKGSLRSSMQWSEWVKSSELSELVNIKSFVVTLYYVINWVSKEKRVSEWVNPKKVLYVGWFFLLMKDST